MIDYSAVTNGVFTLLVALVSGFISYRLSVKEAKSNIDRLRAEQDLSIKKEASLYDFQRKYEMFQALCSSFVDATDASSQLFLIVDYEPQDHNELISFRKRRFLEAGRAHDKARSLLRGTYPFLDEGTFENGMSLLSLMHRQIEGYRLYRLIRSDDKVLQHDSEIVCEYLHNNQELYPRLNKFLSMLRGPLDAMSLAITDAADYKAGS